MPMTRARDEDDDYDIIRRPIKRIKHNDESQRLEEEDYSLPPCCQSDPCVCHPTSDEAWKLYLTNCDYSGEASLYDPASCIYTSELPSQYSSEDDSDSSQSDTEHTERKRFDENGLRILPHVDFNEPKPSLDFSLEYHAQCASYESYWSRKKAAILNARKSSTSFVTKYQKAAAAAATTKPNTKPNPDTRHTEFLAKFKGHRYPVIRLPGFWKRAAKESRDLDAHKVSALSFLLSQGKERRREVESYKLGRFERPDDKEWPQDIADERRRASHSIWHNPRFVKKNPFLIARQEEIRANNSRIETYPLRSYLRWETEGGFKSDLSKGTSVEDFEAEDEEAVTKVEGVEGEGIDEDSPSDDDEIPHNEVSEKMRTKGKLSKGLRG